MVHRQSAHDQRKFFFSALQLWARSSSSSIYCVFFNVKKFPMRECVEMWRHSDYEWMGSFLVGVCVFAVRCLFACCGSLRRADCVPMVCRASPTPLTDQPNSVTQLAEHYSMHSRHNFTFFFSIENRKIVYVPRLVWIIDLDFSSSCLTCWCWRRCVIAISSMINGAIQ